MTVRQSDRETYRNLVRETRCLPDRVCSQVPCPSLPPARPPLCNQSEATPGQEDVNKQHVCRALAYWCPCCQAKIGIGAFSGLGASDNRVKNCHSWNWQLVCQYCWSIKCFVGYSRVVFWCYPFCQGFIIFE